MEPLLKAFKAERSGPTEFFGDYCHRVGKGALLAKLVWLVFGSKAMFENGKTRRTFQ